MSGLCFKTNNESPDISVISRCADIILSGGIVIFPTETVYGIGVNALDTAALERLYTKKQRPRSKPLLCHISGIEQAEQIAVVDDTARTLINRFTPGPLTLVLPKKDGLPDILVAGGDTVGLRFPSNGIFLALARECGVPVAATSANFSGGVSATDFDTLGGIAAEADAVIDGGKCLYSQESTILSLVNEPVILRQGAFPAERLYEVLR